MISSWRKSYRRTNAWLPSEHDSVPPHIDVGTLAESHDSIKHIFVCLCDKNLAGVRLRSTWVNGICFRIEAYVQSAGELAGEGEIPVVVGE